MKKSLLIVLCALCLLLTGCGKKTETNGNAAAAEGAETPASEATAAEIDLTGMSSTMVYSYVYNMITTPDDFLGQRFRIRGTYDEQYWEQTKQTYHYIVIADASSCCAQGLEFVLTDPDAAYPLLGDEFEISGVFGTYEEEGSLYIQITADQIEKG